MSATDVLETGAALSEGRFDEIVWDAARRGGPSALDGAGRVALCAAAQRLGLWDLAREAAQAWAAEGAHVSTGPLVSIVIPTYNRKASLRRTLQSVCAQLYRPLEIVVVNDAGAPVTDVLDAFRAPDVRVVEVVHETNRYLAAARNSGLEKASGTYVCFLDDDDELYPHHVGHLVALLVAGCGGHPLRAARAVPHMRHSAGIARYPARAFDWSELLVENVVPVQAVLLERTLAADAGGFDTSLRVNEDWDFWLRVRERTTVEASPVVTSCVDVTGARMSARSKAPFLAAHATLYGRTETLARTRGGAELRAARRAFLENLEGAVHDEVRAQRTALFAWGAGAGTLPVPELNGDDPACHAATLNAAFADPAVDFVAVVRADLLPHLDPRWTLRLGAQLLADPRRAAAGPLDDGDGGHAVRTLQGLDVPALDAGCVMLRTAPFRGAAGPWRADLPIDAQWAAFFALCCERAFTLRRTFDALFTPLAAPAAVALREVLAERAAPPFAPTVVVGWHRVLPDAQIDAAADPFRLAIGQSAFEAQVRALSAAFRVISADEFGRPSPPDDPRPRVMFTFDDGYRDNYEYAFPLLARLGLPSVLFVSTGFIEGELPYWWEALAAAGTRVPEAEQQAWRFMAPQGREDRVRALGLDAATMDRLRGLAATWPMIRELHESGLVTIGAHTRFHSSLGRLDGATIEAEIAGAREDLVRRLGVAPQLFAFPHGGPEDVSPAALACLSKHGFEYALTTQPGALREAPLPGRVEAMALPRLIAGLRSPEELALAVGQFATAAPVAARREAPAATRRIAVLSGISASNIGDDAMLVATVQEIRRLDPDADVRVLAENPAACGPVAAQIGVPILRSLQNFVRKFVAGVAEGVDPVLALLQVARELSLHREAILQGKRVDPLEADELEGLRWLMGADGVIDCGGANLSPHWKSYFYEKCLDYLVAAQPLFVSGQGIDRLGTEQDRGLLVAALRRAAHVTLREHVSADYLRSLGCSAPFETTADDALTLTASSPAEVCRLLERAGLDPSRSYLAFQFRHYLDYAGDAALDRFAAFVKTAVDVTGLPVLGVPMHFAGTDERAHLAAVGARLPEGTPFTVFPDELTPAQAKGLFGAARAVFGISYHSAVFTLSSCVPYLGIVRGEHYGQKMAGLSALYRMPDLALPLDELTPEAFGAALRDRLRRRDEIGRHLAGRRDELGAAVRRSRAVFVEEAQARAVERRGPPAAQPRTQTAIDWGTLRCFSPVSDKWGFDRGRPVDRFYIEGFLEKHADDVKGVVCELLNDDYTVRYGGSRVTRREILDIDKDNRAATILDDLTSPRNLGTGRFDCFILTQTLSYIYDAGAALRHAYASLKPGGVLLVTVPSTIRFHREPEDHWRFTVDSMARMIAAECPNTEATVAQHGNLVAAIAFLAGMACEDLDPAEIAYNDERFPVVVTARIVKRGAV